MARKARRRISYGKLLEPITYLPVGHLDRLTLLHLAVLPLANSSGGHRLGVNGLAIDVKRSIL